MGSSNSVLLRRNRYKVINFRVSSVNPAINAKSPGFSFEKIKILFKNPAGKIIKNPREKAYIIGSTGSLNLSENITKSAINIDGRIVKLNVKDIYNLLLAKSNIITLR
tara:strand:+ start:949 stop:1272 length:324 start_codon:yes stop_codon:yes gene_type:complete